MDIVIYGNTYHYSIPHVVLKASQSRTKGRNPYTVALEELQGTPAFKVMLANLTGEWDGIMPAFDIRAIPQLTAPWT